MIYIQLHADCKYCGLSYYFHHRNTDEGIIKHFVKLLRRRGWLINVNDGSYDAVCPNCKAEGKTL